MRSSRFDFVARYCPLDLSDKRAAYRLKSFRGICQRIVTYEPQQPKQLALHNTLAVALRLGADGVVIDVGGPRQWQW